MRKSREEVAASIGPLCMQLRAVAAEAKLETLAFLLEMASLEASRLQLQMLQTKTRRRRGLNKTLRTVKRKRRPATASAA